MFSLIWDFIFVRIIDVETQKWTEDFVCISKKKKKQKEQSRFDPKSFNNCTLTPGLYLSLISTPKSSQFIQLSPYFVVIEPQIPSLFWYGPKIWKIELILPS